MSNSLKLIQDGITLKRKMIFDSIQTIEEVQKDTTKMHGTSPVTERRTEFLKELDLIDTHLQSASQSLYNYNTHLALWDIQACQWNVKKKSVK